MTSRFNLLVRVTTRYLILSSSNVSVREASVPRVPRSRRGGWGFQNPSGDYVLKQNYKTNEGQRATVPLYLAPTAATHEIVVLSESSRVTSRSIFTIFHTKEMNYNAKTMRSQSVRK